MKKHIANIVTSIRILGSVYAGLSRIFALILQHVSALRIYGYDRWNDCAKNKLRYKRSKPNTNSMNYENFIMFPCYNLM